MPVDRCLSRANGGERPFEMRFNRRAPSGDVFADAFLRSRKPLCFDDLLAVSRTGEVAEVSAWLGNAVSEGLVEEVPDRERCFRLKARGRRVLSLRRRVVLR